MTKPIGIALFLVLLALAGCGRAGPLEPPPGTPPGAPTASVDTTSTSTGGVNSVVPPQAPTTGSNATPQSKGPPFFLDPLVK